MNAFSFGRAAGFGRAAATPLGAVLDLDFRAGRYVRLGREEALTAISTFARASAADWLNPSGTGFEPAAAANQMRRGSAGALIESAATNLFLNSFSPATQSLSLAAGSYTVQVHGPSGTVTLSGAASGSANAATPFFFSLSNAGTVTATVAGGPLSVSVTPTAAVTAASVFTTSPIQTGGAQASRAAESLTVPVAGLGLAAAWTVVLIGTAARYLPGTDAQVALRLEPNASLGWRFVRLNSGQIVAGQTGAASVALPAAIPNGERFAIAAANDASGISASLNGATVSTAAGSAAALTPEVLRLGGNPGGFNAWSGWVERVAVFARRVSDADVRVLGSLSSWGG